MDSSLDSFLTRVQNSMKAQNISQSELARACDVTPQYLNRWFKTEKSKNLPPSDICYKIAKTLKVDLLWLIAGTGDKKTSNILALAEDEPIPAGYINIPQYEIKFGCGCHGGDDIEPCYSQIHDTTPAIYKSSWIESQGAKPSDCKRFIADGDSMYPIICPGDCILVDTSYEARTQVKKRGIYAIWYDGDLLCKYLTPRISGGLIISSEAKDKYPAEVITAENSNNFYIIGRVIERSGKITNYTN